MKRITLEHVDYIRSPVSLLRSESGDSYFGHGSSNSKNNKQTFHHASHKIEEIINC